MARHSRCHDARPNDEDHECSSIAKVSRPLINVELFMGIEVKDLGLAVRKIFAEVQEATKKSCQLFRHFLNGSRKNKTNFQRNIARCTSTYIPVELWECKS